MSPATSCVVRDERERAERDEDDARDGEEQRVGERLGGRRHVVVARLLDRGLQDRPHLAKPPWERC